MQELIVFVATKDLFKNIIIFSSLIKLQVILLYWCWFTFKICLRYAYFDKAVINTRIKLTYKNKVHLVASLWLIVNIKKF